MNLHPDPSLQFLTPVCSLPVCSPSATTAIRHSAPHLPLQTNAATDGSSGTFGRVAELADARA